MTSPAQQRLWLATLDAMERQPDADAAPVEAAPRRRPVSHLNQHLVYEYFSYTTVGQTVEQATPGCWFSKLDLSNCFLSFPLHPSAWPYFIYRFDGQLYQFTRRPFGLSSAPRICTELLAVLAIAMKQCGVDRSDRYLDDKLLTDDTAEAAGRSVLIAQHTMTCFGLVINPDKTEGPAQRLAFLGIQLDSVARTLSCTPERLREIVELLDEDGNADVLPLSRLQPSSASCSSPPSCCPMPARSSSA